MKLRMMQTRLAVGLCAAGILSLSVSSAWAFSRENVSPGDGGNYTFNDPNDKLTDPDNHSSGQSADRSVQMVRRCSSVSSRVR